jgi:DNA-directed RNA polymerase subunit K/omega
MDVTGASASRWSLGPLVSWTIPNIVAARARIAAAKAETKASLAQFDGTVLIALEETERALSNLSHARQRADTLQRAPAMRHHARPASALRVSAKGGSILTVLDAQRTWPGPRPIWSRPAAPPPLPRSMCSAPLPEDGRRYEKRAGVSPLPRPPCQRVTSAMTALALTIALSVVIFRPGYHRPAPSTFQRPPIRFRLPRPL